MNDSSPGSPDNLWDLPKEPPPRRLPPRLSLDQYVVRIAEIRAWFPQSIPTPEERLRSKVDVPFELEASSGANTVDGGRKV